MPWPHHRDNLTRSYSEQEALIAQQCSRTLASRAGSVESLHVKLGDGTDLILPASAMRVLMDALVQMAQGNAVTIIPIHSEMTSQQAADFLNVSRPYFVHEILQKGKIPFRKLGTHRRILFKDLIDYKNAIDTLSQQAFRELTRQAQQLDMRYRR